MMQESVALAKQHLKTSKSMKTDADTVADVSDRPKMPLPPSERLEIVRGGLALGACTSIAAHPFISLVRQSRRTCASSCCWRPPTLRSASVQIAADHTRGGETDAVTSTSLRRPRAARCGTLCRSQIHPAHPMAPQFYPSLQGQLGEAKAPASAPALQTPTVVEAAAARHYEPRDMRHEQRSDRAGQADRQHRPKSARDGQVAAAASAAPKETEWRPPVRAETAKPSPPAAVSEWRPEQRARAADSRVTSGERAPPKGDRQHGKPAQSTSEWRGSTAENAEPSRSSKAASAPKSASAAPVAQATAESGVYKGMLCYALYVEEDRYYEATVLSVDGSKVTVRYVGFEDDPPTTLRADQIVPT